MPASPLIRLSGGRGRIDHCPLLGEEGTVNKVAFGRAWKCRRAPPSLCGINGPLGSARLSPTRRLVLPRPPQWPQPLVP